MTYLKDRFDFLYNGEATKRFHTVRTLGQNTVAEHSFTMLWLIFLMKEGKWQHIDHIFMAAITHDIAEWKAGDMPAPSKRATKMGEALSAYEGHLLSQVNLYFSLDEEDKRILKLADCLSGLLFCVTERAMGNTFVTESFNNYCAYIKELEPALIEKELFDIIVQKWRAIA